MVGKDWPEVDAFKNIYLTASELMAFWPGPDRSFVWRIDFNLLPQHENFRPHQGEDIFCVRRGSLIAKNCQSVGIGSPGLGLPNYVEGFNFGEIRECRISDTGFSLSAETVSFGVECETYSIEFDEE